MQCVTLPLMAWVIMNNMMLQTTGKALQASILALARQGLFFLPVIFVLPALLAIAGIQLSQPVADVLTFAIAVPMGLGFLSELKAKEHGGEAQEPGRADG